MLFVSGGLSTDMLEGKRRPDLYDSESTVAPHTHKPIQMTGVAQALPIERAFLGASFEG